MAVMKRLRFEILRRDGHTCRYCGAKAPDVSLHVDHVIPEALGGTDDPTNLVTACGPCNSGKSSIAPDAAIVADVAADALRWATALEVVARQRAEDRSRRGAIHAQFIDEWKGWATAASGFGRYHVPAGPVPIGADWKRSVNAWLDAGLTVDDLIALIEVAMTKSNSGAWRYFCGCAWRTVSDAQQSALAIVGGA